ncbi:MAG: hypothetical protein J6Y58_04910 [Clostridiales bacterium]|nr:hypothetical protein [Clostridiales bacterium]
MNKEKTRIMLAGFILLSLLFSFVGYFIAKNNSYQKYKSGEYFFREKAHTWSSTDPYEILGEDAMNTDYTDPMNILLRTNNVTVYAYDPEGSVCTIISDKTTIENFPIGNLEFENEDLGNFYGTRQYSSDEYFDLINSLSKAELNSPRVSSKKMVAYKDAIKSTIMLFIIDLCLAIAIYAFLKFDFVKAVDVVLILGTGISVIFNIQSALRF